MPQLRSELKALDERNRQQQQNSQTQLTSLPQATPVQHPATQAIKPVQVQQSQPQQGPFIQVKTTSGQIVTLSAQLYQQLQQQQQQQQQKQQIAVSIPKPETPQQQQQQPLQQPQLSQQPQQPQQQQPQQQQQVVIQPVYSAPLQQQAQQPVIIPQQQPSQLQQAASTGTASPKAAPARPTTCMNKSHSGVLIKRFYSCQEVGCFVYAYQGWRRRYERQTEGNWSRSSRRR